MNETNLNVKLIVIDFLCGAGGVTEGFEKAEVNGERIARIVAALNHDPGAIASHLSNFIHVKHFIEDLRNINFEELNAIIEVYRILYPNAKIVFWFSLECTNFSKAKGGLPRNADSRTLADELIKKFNPVTGKHDLPGYIPYFMPDYIKIENVEEFMSWGPLDEFGKPISRRNGSDYVKWCNKIQSYGYNYDWQIINAADFGAYTSRKRYFGIFSKAGLPVAWPKPTHAKKPQQEGMFGMLQKWKAVRDVLDLQDTGNTIFGRKKDLSEKTLARIYAGLIKYVAGGKDQFLVKYNSFKDGRYAAPDLNEPLGVVTTRNTHYLATPEFLLKYNSTNQETGVHVPPGIDEPCPTVAVQPRLGLVQPQFISKYFSGKPEHKNISINGPAGTVKTIDSQCLISSEFITQSHGGDPKKRVSSVDNPLRTITNIDNKSLVNPQFLDVYYGNSEPQGLDTPARTLRTKGSHALITSQFIDKQYSGDANHQSIDQPAGAILSNDKHSLVSAEHFIMNTQYNAVGSSLETPLSTITANRKWHYLINPTWGGNNSSVDKPCCTVVASQHKAPLYLVTTEEGFLAIEIFETDSEYTQKIKEFMALYGIIDIKMRMLKVNELLKIQGFPEGYILKGNQADQKKFIGNAVVPLVAQKLAEALAERLNEFEMEELAA